MTYTFKLSRRLAVIFLVGVLALVLVVLGFILGSTSDTTRHLVGNSVAALLQSGLAMKFFYLIIVGIGCAAGRVFPFQREFKGSREFLEHMFPGHSQVYYERADFFLTCVMGSLLGMLIVQPTSVHTALATGLGWPFIVRFLVEGMKQTGRPAAPSPVTTLTAGVEPGQYDPALGPTLTSGSRRLHGRPTQSAISSSPPAPDPSRHPQLSRRPARD